jgi:hypothetical protein
MILDAGGRFEFRRVPEESVGLTRTNSRLQILETECSLDWLNGGLVGRVTEDLQLTLLMEPGQWRPNGEEGDPPSGNSHPAISRCAA